MIAKSIQKKLGRGKKFHVFRSYENKVATPQLLLHLSI